MSISTAATRVLAEVRPCALDLAIDQQQRREPRVCGNDLTQRGALERRDDAVTERGERLGRLDVNKARQGDHVAREQEAQNLAAAIVEQRRRHQHALANDEHLAGAIILSLDRRASPDRPLAFLEPFECRMFRRGKGNQIAQSFGETTA